jgi:hypothetical protein
MDITLILMNIAAEERDGKITLRRITQGQGCQDCGGGWNWPGFFPLEVTKLKKFLLQLVHSSSAGNLIVSSHTKEQSVILCKLT